MAYSAIVNETVTVAGVQYANIHTLTGTGVVGFEETVNNGITDKEVEFTLDWSVCTVFYLCSDQDVSFQTNAAVGPDDIIDLKAGVPYIWYTNKPAQCPFLIDNDISTDGIVGDGIFLTNGSGTNATVRCEALVDATP